MFEQLTKCYRFVSGNILIFSGMKALFTSVWLLSSACTLLAQSTRSVKTAPIPADDAAIAAEIRAETGRSWQAYRRYAWKHDELKPLTKTYHDWYKQPISIAPIDGYPTLKLMGFAEAAKEIETFVVDSVRFDRDQYVKTYEVYQRILGGLLCMYQYTGNERVLQKAEEFGKRLLPAFSSKTGIPYFYINLKTGQAKGDTVNVAEGGSYVLEMGILSYYTKNPVYYQAGMRAERAIFSRRSKLDLVGEIINVQTGQWLSERSHVGAYIDSYYEYMYKSWLLFGDPELRVMWDKSIRAINRYVADETDSTLWYAQVNMHTGKRMNRFINVWDAYFPALLALSGDVKRAAKHQDAWDKLWDQYGMLPERYNYETRQVVDPPYTLNPEIMESAYYLYHYTGDVKYKQRILKYYRDIVRHCRTDVAYTVISDVRTHAKGDALETFFIAETMKYMYLPFWGEAKFRFDEYVFTTEAHPFRKARFTRTESKKWLGF